jgi:hypothetical protein
MHDKKKTAGSAKQRYLQNVDMECNFGQGTKKLYNEDCNWFILYYNFFYSYAA